MEKAKDIIKQLFHLAGIEINGSKPWDIHVHDNRFYDAVLYKKSLGLGESYMAGWWDCLSLDESMARLIMANIESKVKDRFSLYLNILTKRLLNFQTKRGALIVAKKHYNIGNELFSRMLDKYMMYSCGYWKTATNLDQAQTDKLDLICKKLDLQPGMKLLDIGCGWGGMAQYAAEHYGVSVVGITISEEQARLAKQRCAGLPVDIRLQDYRELAGKFDRVVSIGMFEHVGHKNYRHYMQIVKQCMATDGLFLLHTLGSNYSVVHANEWLNKYIFPNGMLPSIKQLGSSLERTFIMEDWHNFGSYYYPTLMSWHHNFNQYWDELKSHYNEEFRRMWNFYLLSCAGSARARDIQLWQIVLSNGNDGVYNSIR